MKIFGSKNYINYKLQNFFDSERLTPAENNILSAFILAQKQYGKLTNKKWAIVEKIYLKYKEKYENRSESEDIPI